MANGRRLIVANMLLEIVNEIPDRKMNGVTIAAAIAQCPTVDAVEVVHGQWVFGTTNHHEWMKCSECLVSQTPTGCFTYCPNCGAKMVGD